MDLIGVKGSYQHVVPAQIQHLRPQALVGEPGGDDQPGWFRQPADFIQQQLPVSVLKITLANDHRHRLGLGLAYTLRQCRHASQLPREAGKYGLEEAAILRAKVHCQDHVGMSATANGANSVDSSHLPELRLVFSSLIVTTVPGAFARSTGWYPVSGACRNCLGACQQSCFEGSRQAPQSVVSSVERNSRRVQKEKEQ